MRPFRVRNGVKIDLTDEEILELQAKESQAEYNSVMDARIEGYGKIGDQLDLLFKEVRDTGTISQDGAWFKRIQAVKESNPKPGE